MFAPKEQELLVETIAELIKKNIAFAASDISRYSATRGCKIPLHIVKDLLQKKHQAGELPNYTSELYKAKSFVDWAYIPNNTQYKPLDPSEIAEQEHPLEIRNTDKEGRLSIPLNFLKIIGLIPGKEYTFTIRPKWLRIGMYGELKHGNISKRGELRINPSTLTSAKLGREALAIACFADCLEIYPKTNLP